MGGQFEPLSGSPGCRIQMGLILRSVNARLFDHLVRVHHRGEEYAGLAFCAAPTVTCGGTFP